MSIEFRQRAYFHETWERHEQLYKEIASEHTKEELIDDRGLGYSKYLEGVDWCINSIRSEWTQEQEDEFKRRYRELLDWRFEVGGECSSNYRAIVSNVIVMNIPRDWKPLPQTVALLEENDATRAKIDLRRMSKAIHGTVALLEKHDRRRAKVPNTYF